MVKTIAEGSEWYEKRRRMNRAQGVQGMKHRHARSLHTYTNIQVDTVKSIKRTVLSLSIVMCGSASTRVCVCARVRCAYKPTHVTYNGFYAGLANRTKAAPKSKYIVSNMCGAGVCEKIYIGSVEAPSK